MSKKVIILGGRGFLGTALCAEAGRRGWETVAVGSADYAERAGAACDLIINANGNSKKYLADRDPTLDFDLSVRSVSRSLHDFRAGLYIYLSTIDVYPNKSNPACNHEDTPIAQDKISAYGFHKHLAEQIVRRNAPAWIILRLGGFVGKGLKKNSIYDMLHGQPLRVHPDSRYQYMDCAAMAQIAFQLAESRHFKSTFNVTGEGTVSLREIARLIPGTPLAGAPAEAAPEHYEVNISRIKMFAEIPPTRKTVENYVKGMLAGAEQSP